jgi:phage repressor protein C with HTH and peptisase S24 domain
MDDALLVKQLQRLPGGLLRVISRNQAYEPFTVQASELDAPAGLSIIGRVVWACRRL